MKLGHLMRMSECEVLKDTLMGAKFNYFHCKCYYEGILPQNVRVGVSQPAIPKFAVVDDM